MNKKFNIEQFLSLDGYATEERESRRKGSKGTQEFYTPINLVKHMCSKISEHQWNNPNSNMLEPSMGNGQFICYIIYNKIMHGSTWEQALLHTYGIELIESNVQETYTRIFNMFSQMNIDFDKDKALKIMKHNLVCSSFFDWDFENWKPIENKICNGLF